MHVIKAEATAQPRGRMPLVEALRVLRDWRENQIVVTTMGAAREWPKLSSHPLDFHYIPSAMGEAPLLALGLALAQPEREVVCLNGDGCMLMNLGALVTIAASGATNFTLIVLDNGLYEVTGGQQTAASIARADFARLAAAAGIGSVRAYGDADAWRCEAGEALTLPGPRFIALGVEPVGSNYHLSAPGPMAERLAAFRQALGG